MGSEGSLSFSSELLSSAKWSSSRSGANISQQSRNHLKNLDTWRLTGRQLRMEDQEILGTTIQNSFAMATWGSEICAALSSRNFFSVLEGQFLYRPPICINVFQVICYFKFPHQQLLDHFSCLPFVPHTPQIFSLSSCYCTTSSTNHKAPYYVILYSLLLIPPSYV